MILQWLSWSLQKVQRPCSWQRPSWKQNFKSALVITFFLDFRASSRGIGSTDSYFWGWREHHEDNHGWTCYVTPDFCLQLCIWANETRYQLTFFCDCWMLTSCCLLWNKPNSTHVTGMSLGRWFAIAHKLRECMHSTMESQDSTNLWPSNLSLQIGRNLLIEHVLIIVTITVDWTWIYCVHMPDSGSVAAYSSDHCATPPVQIGNTIATPGDTPAPKTMNMAPLMSGNPWPTCFQ